MVIRSLVFTLTQHCEETDVATDAVTNDGHSELTLAAFSTVLTILTFTLPMSSVSALRKQQQHFTSAEEKQLCRDVRTEQKQKPENMAQRQY